MYIYEHKIIQTFTSTNLAVFAKSLDTPRDIKDIVRNQFQSQYRESITGNLQLDSIGGQIRV